MSVTWRRCVFAPWAEVLVDIVGAQAGAEVLDVASGTGVVSRRAAARLQGSSGRVVASDVSAAMLSHAASVPAPAGIAPIEYLEASVTELPLDDRSFDSRDLPAGHAVLYRSPRRCDRGFECCGRAA